MPPPVEPPIILIGPMSAGKSTVGPLLAERLDLPYYELDENRWDYYEEIGYDNAEATRIAQSDAGMAGLLQYWKPFEAHAVERAVAEHSNCVIEFGAGHSVYEDPVLFARVQRVLAPLPNIVLLLPSPDLDESTRILNARFRQLLLDEVGTIDPALFDVNEQFVKHPSNYRLAKFVIYTNGKTPTETCADILTQLGQSAASDSPPPNT